MKFCLALDLLHHANLYLSHQWNEGMNRLEAQSNLGARIVLFNCSNAILAENGMGITRAEVEA